MYLIFSFETVLINLFVCIWFKGVNHLRAYNILFIKENNVSAFTSCMRISASCVKILTFF